DVLLDTDPNVVDAAARSLMRQIPSLEPSHRRALTEQVLKLLARKKGPRLPPHAEPALIRLLAAIGDPRAEAVYWARIEPAHSPELRAAALQALGTLPLSTNRDKLKRLLACAADADFRGAAPALMLLKAAPVNDRAMDDWLPLFQSADPAARRFAMEKLGHKDTAIVAEALLGQLNHPDRSLRDQALACLGQLPRGREA